MKHEVIESYKDATLNRRLEKEKILEEEYEKDKVKLTEERIKYLLDKKVIKEKEENKKN